MNRILAAIGFLLITPLALAGPTEIRWELPTAYCDGAPVGIDDIDAMEIYISAAPIPASDQSCTPDGGTPDQPPDSFSSKVELPQADIALGSVTVNLFGGTTYFVRARVRVGTNWSNFSNERTLEVPAPVITAPVIISFGG